MIDADIRTNVAPSRMYGPTRRKQPMNGGHGGVHSELNPEFPVTAPP